MRCRKVICADCRTRVDGVNHCHACLRALGRSRAAPADGGQVVERLLTAGLLLGVGVVVLFALGWLGQGLLAALGG
jgi:hypothetical protein